MVEMSRVNRSTIFAIALVSIVASVSAVTVAILVAQDIGASEDEIPLRMEVDYRSGARPAHLMPLAFL